MKPVRKRLHETLAGTLAVYDVKTVGDLVSCRDARQSTQNAADFRGDPKRPLLCVDLSSLCALCGSQL